MQWLSILGQKHPQKVTRSILRGGEMIMEVRNKEKLNSATKYFIFHTFLKKKFVCAAHTIEISKFNVTSLSRISVHVILDNLQNTLCFYRDYFITRKSCISQNMDK